MWLIIKNEKIWIKLKNKVCLTNSAKSSKKSMQNTNLKFKNVVICKNNYNFNAIAIYYNSHQLSH